MTSRSLTKGERRVLRAYVTEETHELAASSLDISTQTLKNHLGSIYKKVGVRKAHAAVYKLALEAGCDPLAEPSEASETVTEAAGTVETTNLLARDETFTDVLGGGLTIEPADAHNDVDEAAN